METKIKMVAATSTVTDKTVCMSYSFLVVSDCVQLSGR